MQQLLVPTCSSFGQGRSSCLRRWLSKAPLAIPRVFASRVGWRGHDSQLQKKSTLKKEGRKPHLREQVDLQGLPALNSVLIHPPQIPSWPSTMKSYDGAQSLVSSVGQPSLEPIIPWGQSGEDAFNQATTNTGERKSGDTMSWVGGSVVERSTDTFSDIWDVCLSQWNR